MMCHLPRGFKKGTEKKLMCHGKLNNLSNCRHICIVNNLTHNLNTCTADNNGVECLHGYCILRSDHFVMNTAKYTPA